MELQLAGVLLDHLGQYLLELLSRPCVVSFGGVSTIVMPTSFDVDRVSVRVESPNRGESSVGREPAREVVSGGGHGPGSGWDLCPGPSGGRSR